MLSDRFDSDDTDSSAVRSTGVARIILWSLLALAVLASVASLIAVVWSSSSNSSTNDMVTQLLNTTTNLVALNQALSARVGQIQSELDAITQRCDTPIAPPPPQVVYEPSAACGSVNQSSIPCAGVCSQANLDRPRARDLGVPFSYPPGGVWNAITDVPGVLVGHSTLICNEGADAVRSGVTAILPRGIGGKAVAAGFYSLSGNGEMTGTHWIAESGCMMGPVVTTVTASVGTVLEAVTAYSISIQQQYPEWFNYLPVVSETWSGALDSMDRLNVRAEHVQQAIECAASSAVAEGSVGGGTGMRTFAFKSGIGTASRTVAASATTNYTLGVIVQSNFGARFEATVAGVPVGEELLDVLLPILHDPLTKQRVQYDPDANAAPLQPGDRSRVDGSFVCIIATDAPLRPIELQRIARRASLGYSRTGGSGAVSSGDLFLAFSTAPGNCPEVGDNETRPVNDYAMSMTPFFLATIDAVEEAIVNALMAADDMIGVDGNVMFALPPEKLQEILRKYNRCNC